MSRDAEYQALLNKYNVAVAQNRDLRDQMETKDRQFRAYESRCDVVDSHARKLCEAILAKDKSEMTLGDAKTWHSFSTDEMIAKATNAFVRYCQTRTELLNRVMEVAEKRRLELESLKDQISQIMRNGNASQLASVEEMMENAQKELEAKTVISKAPNSTQKAIAEGRVEAVIEEDGDCDENELSHITHMLRTRNEIELTPGSPTISRCPQKSELIKKENAALAAQVINYEAIVQEYTETDWNVLYILGHFGVSKTRDILAKYDECYKERGNGSVERSLTKFGTNQTIYSETVKLPTKAGKISLHYLSPIGRTVFKTRFGEEAVMSEYEKVQKKHDNPTHGYGILELKKVLEESGRYHSVSADEPGIEVTIGETKLTYVPDLKCETGNFVDYFEYELNTHKQVDFNMKCNKMCKVTKFLNFIVPKIDEARKLKNKVDTWIESRKVESLKNITVRIGTIRSIENDGKWLVQYNLSKGAEPVIDSLDK